jgi:3-dehydrosphinganine reductase
MSLAYPSTQAGIKKMVRQKVPGKVVFVGSMLSYMSFAGWSNYAPGKHALRGKRRVDLSA